MRKQKQVDNTKTEIIDSLKLLLKKNKYDDITISDISKTSHVSRTTIYRHYESKRDIVIDLITRDFFNATEENTTTRALLTHRLNALLESKFHIHIMESTELAKIFFGMKNNSFVDSLNINDKRKTIFILGGVDFTIRTWAMSDFKQGVDELVDDIMDLISKVKCEQHS